MTPTYQGQDCGSEYGADGLANAPTCSCTRPAGHHGVHYDAVVGLAWSDNDPPAGLLPRVDELRRQVEWAAQLHEQFCAALGPEYVGPFSADPTSAILRSIDTARRLDDVLREAGIEHPTGLRGVEDLANQRDGALEHVTELREAVRAEIVTTVHYGHTPTLDECTHHQCVALRKAAAA